MKILVIGGSYFYGRVFVMEYAKEHVITVVNRGTYSMKDFGAAQVTGDRRQKALWQGLCGDYDVIVDFCAYEKGDVETVLYHLQGKVTQYILISTVDVYQRGGDGPKREDAPFEKRHFPGEAGRYIAGKTALEEEVRRVCAEKGVKCTVLRPAILYGPYNYAPREAWFIRLAVEIKAQNVNKTATAVRLTFRFLESPSLSDAVKERLRVLCGAEFVSFLARESRSLPENREAARCRLAALIASAKRVPRKRRPTRPTRASKERRLKEKSRRSEIKAGRGKVQD